MLFYKLSMRTRDIFKNSLVVSVVNLQLIAAFAYLNVAGAGPDSARLGSPGSACLRDCQRTSSGRAAMAVGRCGANSEGEPCSHRG